MVDSLTPRQREIFNYIKRRIAERGYPPSVREIGEALGLRSSSTVHGHLSRLEQKGYLRRDPTKPRAIKILVEADGGHLSPLIPFPSGGDDLNRNKLVPVPVLGRVTAGQPVLAVENLEDTLLLPKDWLRGQDVFMLRVRGDSMIQAGIIENDLVIVLRQDTASNGDIVVALLEDEATVKRFFREQAYVRLQPENPRMAPIITREVRILGRVIGLLRRF